MPFAFLNWPLLLGLPAMSIPLIIHLAQRRKFKVVQWGAMEFLLLSEAKTTRKRRIQQLILLILRMLMVLLIILAAARPLLKGSKFAGLIGKESTHAIIILDDSYSMGATSGAERSFDRAKKAVVDILSLLKTSDAVTVIRASDPPKIVVELNFKPQLVKLDVQDLKLSTRATNYVGALAIASKELDRFALPRKEVYVVGDFQVVGWKRGATGETDPLTEVSKKSQVFLVKVPPVSDQNAAVTGVDFPRGLVDTANLARVVVSIKNFSASDMHHVTAKLMVDDQEVDRKPLSLKAKSEEFVEFRRRFERGRHHGYVQMSDDVLEVDNQHYFHVTAREQIKVLCVDGWDEKEGASRFYQMAMNPTGKSPITIKTIHSNQFNRYSDQLRDYQVVVLANVPQVDSAVADQLQNYVQQGGAVLVGLGDQVQMFTYNEWLYRRGEGIFPGRLVGVRGEAKTKKSRYFPTTFKQDHPLLKVFSDMELTDLKACTVYQAYNMEVPQDPNVTVLMALQDQTPLLIEKRFGRGRVLVWTTSLDDTWNDLPTIQHLMYLPLMSQMTAHLAGGKSEAILVGQPIVRKFSFREFPDQSEFPFMVTPDKERIKTETSVGEGGIQIRFTKTDLPGSYVLTRPGDTGAELDRFSINLNTEESNLETLDESRLRALFPEAKFRFLDTEKAVRDIVAQEQVGVELWKPLLKLLLMLAAVEFLLAHLFSFQLRAAPVRATS